MEEFYKFLEENGINKNLFTVNKLEIDDIFLLNKVLHQHVEQERRQNKEERRDWLEENKEEFSRNHQFDKNDFKIGQKIIWGIEPGTYAFDDCLTCDGHGEITCKRCDGHGEITCPTCKGKTYIERKEIKTNTEEKICDICNGSGKLTNTCNFCHGRGIIEKKERCFSCGGKGVGINGLPCQSCRGQGFVLKNEKCFHCQGGIITRNCNACGGKGKKILVKNEELKINEKCSTCKASGKIMCPTCGGNRSLTCPTCHGERKTFQYLLNKFTITVELKPILVMKKQLNENIGFSELLKKIPIKGLSKITEDEKKEIVSVINLNNIKIDEKNVSRIKGDLYRFQHKETNLFYFVFHNKFDKIFYFSSLPPKTNLEAKIDKYYQIFKIKFEKIMKKLKDWFYGRNEY